MYTDCYSTFKSWLGCITSKSWCSHYPGNILNVDHSPTFMQPAWRIYRLVSLSSEHRSLNPLTSQQALGYLITVAHTSRSVFDILEQYWFFFFQCYLYLFVYYFNIFFLGVALLFLVMGSYMWRKEEWQWW